MITVRSSTVESFRLYIDPDVDFISTEEMEARLRGESTSSRAADLGTAFHAAVADDYVGAVLFDDASIAKARAGLEGAVPEVSGSIVIDVDGVPVRLTGHTDWLRGLEAWDLKTSDKPIPPERPHDSMQWRCYCLIFGVERFVYRHAQLAEDDDGLVYAKSIDDVVMYRYPHLRDDVVRCLRSLLAFAALRGCIDSMKEDAP